MGNAIPPPPQPNLDITIGKSFLVLQDIKNKDENKRFKKGELITLQDRYFVVHGMSSQWAHYVEFDATDGRILTADRYKKKQGKKGHLFGIEGFPRVSSYNDYGDTVYKVEAFPNPNFLKQID